MNKSCINTLLFYHSYVGSCLCFLAKSKILVILRHVLQICNYFQRYSTPRSYLDIMGKYDKKTKKRDASDSDSDSGPEDRNGKAPPKKV